VRQSSRPLLFLLSCAAAALLLTEVRVSAQGPPPPISGLVVDLRGTFPRFGDNQQLADSRGLTMQDLPGAGLGLDVGAHYYVFRWKVITFGIGGQFTFGRSHSSAEFLTGSEAGQTTVAVTERFTSIAPQLSFNFGSGDGWSYLSGGIGSSQWSIVPDGGAALSADRERLKTVNYGGGARWLVTPKVAFNLDVRFYQMDPGTPEGGRPGSPRTTLLVLGGGISVKYHK